MDWILWNIQGRDNLFLSGNWTVDVDKPFVLAILLFYIFFIICMMYFNLSGENEE